jgi:hypothetical protein
MPMVSVSSSAEYQSRRLRLIENHLLAWQARLP